MGNSVMLNGVEYTGEQIAYKDSTYELVSKVAYLIGVPLRIFQNEHEPPKIEIYNRLEQDKNARIIRNLCIIRTAIERNYRKINDIMRMEYRGLLSMPEIIPASSMQQLSNDGISFIKKSSTKLCHHCALPGFVDSKNEEKTERNAGYLVVSHSGGGMLRQGTRKGIRRTPANRGMRAHRIVKSLDISEDVCHGLCP